MAKVGSARIDENGNLVGGQSGDNNSKEVMIQDYYIHKKGWYLYRAIDNNVAKKLSQAMRDACNNNNIGYDQGNRNDVITQLKKYGSLKAIATPTECDCSSLVRACCMEAGFDPGNFTTATEGSALDKTGKFQPRIEVTNTTIIYESDILITRTKGHTVICVEGESRGKATQKNTKEVKALRSASKRNNSLAGTYVTTNNLHMRDGAGKDYKSLVIIPKKTSVYCYGFYSVADNKNWLYVQTSIEGVKYTGFCSSTFLVKQ